MKERFDFSEGIHKPQFETEMNEEDVKKPYMNELYYSKGKKETRVGKQGTPLLNITANSKN